MASIGDRGVPLVGSLYPLGRLVRQATIENVYGWLAGGPELIQRYLERANDQVAQTVEAMTAVGVGPCFSVTAHEMLIPPWMSPDARGSTACDTGGSHSNGQRR